MRLEGETATSSASFTGPYAQVSESPHPASRNGSVLLADGVGLATVSERLGHSSARVTADIYSHALRGRDQDAAKRWDQFMRRNGGSPDSSVL